jgi:hypothetical protein
MAADALMIVCAWCHRVIKAAPRGASVTHTICPSCLEWTMTHPSAVIEGDQTPAFEQPSSPADYLGDPFKR